MARLDEIQLGDAVNLLYGVDGLPLAARPALVSPPRTPLQRFPVSIDRSTGPGWRPPRVTLHHDVTSLVSELSLHRVMPLFFDGPTFSVQPDLLLRDETDRAGQQRRLGETLGVELAEGRTYLLVAVRRVDGRVDHEVTGRWRYFDRIRHLTPEWRKMSSQLRPGERIHDGTQHDAVITAAMAQRYLDCFYEFGTHFVSAVEAGDALFQVVALRPEVCAEVSHYWRQIGGGSPVEGDAALGFAPFLRRIYALQVGCIVNRANDPELAAGAAQGVWSDPGGLQETSLLGLLRSGREAVHAALDPLRAVTPIGIELTSLARFIEYYRAINWERVLRGALMQRWGDRVRLPLRRMPHVERSIAATVLQSDDAPPDEISPRCCRLLRLSGLLPHQAFELPVPLLAQFVDAAPACHTAPVLRLAEEAFERPGLICQTMAGALLLETDSGKRDAVVDGLRFTDAEPAADTALRRVRVRGDLHIPDAGELARVLPSIELALANTAAVLAVAGTSDEQRRAEAASFAGWLADLLSADSDDPRVRRLRVIALYLSRIERGLPVGRLFSGAMNGRMRDQLAGISALAIKADELLRDYGARLWARARSAGSSAQPGRTEEAGIIEALRSLNRRTSTLYLALLSELRPGCREALEQSVRAQRDTAFALTGAAAVLQASFAGQEPDPASRLVLETIASAGHSPLPPDPNLLSRRREEAVGAAIEFAGREARWRAYCAQIEAMEAACGSLANDPGAIEAVESGLAHLAATPPPSDTPVLRAEIADGPFGDKQLQSATEEVLAAWAGFAAARRDLLVARSAFCRMEMESWYHSQLDPGEQPARDEPSGREAAGPAQVELERFRLLTLLGRVLQLAALDTTGLPPPAMSDGFEPGVIGRLIAMQCALSPTLQKGGFHARELPKEQRHHRKPD